MPYSLGRVVQHDPRSLAYAHGVLPKSAIQSVQWKRQAAHFDQKNLGSCSGNAPAGIIVTNAKNYTGVTRVTISSSAAAKTHGVFKAQEYAVDEDFAVLCYELNTILDSFPGQYPPDDTGSSGLAAAKTLVALGLADTYTHGFSISALDSALQNGPVMAGTNWMESMFDPDSNGVLKVDRNSEVVGGHEYVISGLDVDKGLYTIDNSWGDSWGKSGQGFVAKADMQWLLSQQGDVTVPHLVTPAPQPTPTPTPTPTPADVDGPLATAMRTWLTAKGL